MLNLEVTNNHYFVVTKQYDIELLHQRPATSSWRRSPLRDWDGIHWKD